ncbi:hypothetical protein KCU65_g10, partial [Aureobasidium melanogenum]
MQALCDECRDVSSTLNFEKFMINVHGHYLPSISFLPKISCHFQPRVEYRLNKTLCSPLTTSPHHKMNLSTTRHQGFTSPFAETNCGTIRINARGIEMDVEGWMLSGRASSRPLGATFWMASGTIEGPVA